MSCVLIDLGFKDSINLVKLKDFKKDEIEFLICANKNIDTFGLRKSLGDFKFYIFEPTLYISNEDEIAKLKHYFLKNTNSSSIISYKEFEEFGLRIKSDENIRNRSFITTGKDLKLAFFSPLPDEKTGVSLYSVELLKELCKYYDITVIVEKLDNVNDDIKKLYNVRDVNYFLTNSNLFDRIVYQMGGSHYHLYMYEILKKFEGVVVFHDFYMSQLVYTGDTHYLSIFFDELYDSHGYAAFSFFKKYGMGQTVLKYPVNRSLINHSLGVIVHSNEPKRIFDLLYGTDNNIFENIPLLRQAAEILPKDVCKKELNLPKDKFIICTFGYIGTTKLTFEVVKGFKKTTLLAEDRAVLVLAGASTNDEYMDLIKDYIKEHGLHDKIIITGWLDDILYKKYLNVCDIAIQLRKDSRGESSAAVLDCFNYSLPAIVNKHGSMRDLPEESVYFIEDEFTPYNISNAIDKIYIDKNLRDTLSGNAKKYLDKFHNPEICAEKYSNFIEKSYSKKPLLKNIISDFKNSNSDLTMLSKAISSIKLPLHRQNTIFVDITEIYVNDIKTGIQRVVRAQLLMLLNIVKFDYKVEPVYYDDTRSTYFCARDFMRGFYSMHEWSRANEIPDMHHGDIFYGLDYMPIGVVNAYKKDIYRKMRAKGVKVFFVIYDIIPILYPQFVPPVSPRNHDRWAKSVIDSADGLVCISDSVVKDVKKYILDNSLRMPSIIKSMKLGCDIKSSLPVLGLDNKSKEILNKILSKPTFLMVGTLEPRKGHDATIAAFDVLWQRGYDINLVIVGKVGWMVDELCEVIGKHDEKDKRLIYLNFVSDEMLEEIYKSSSCLIAASRAEGFGLPLVEAAIHKIPIIARELEVFKEVSNDSATFFASDEQLPAVIAKWLDDFKESKHIKSDKIELVSWQESSIQAYKILTGDF
ncbi:glycosyltransferase [Campylobacter sp. RM16190]|uniref:glycosyltransferase n=1 Tax=Campylobacter sp. RM16190 TaxID=1705727 RepID=UPI001475E1E8|nr:glycosyltransferase [Campylobacter sp. RM16190]